MYRWNWYNIRTFLTIKIEKLGFDEEINRSLSQQTRTERLLVLKLILPFRIDIRDCVSSATMRLHPCTHRDFDELSRGSNSFSVSILAGSRTRLVPLSQYSHPCFVRSNIHVLFVFPTFTILWYTIHHSEIMNIQNQDIKNRIKSSSNPCRWYIFWKKVYTNSL